MSSRLAVQKPAPFIALHFCSAAFRHQHRYPLISEKMRE